MISRKYTYAFVALSQQLSILLESLHAHLARLIRNPLLPQAIKVKLLEVPAFTYKRHDTRIAKGGANFADGNDLLQCNALPPASARTMQLYTGPCRSPTP